MSFFHKKIMSQNVWATIMPFGPVTNFLLAQKKISGTGKSLVLPDRGSSQGYTALKVSMLNITPTHFQHSINCYSE
jgi:hypothetical protein